MTPLLESRHNPDIASVWSWLEFQKELIDDGLSSVLRMFSATRGHVVPVTRPYESQFIDFTRQQVKEFFEEQRSQMELAAMLELLATTEAVLRIDFRNRVKKRRKDPLSRRYREIHRDRSSMNERPRIRLSEDVLEALSEEEGVNVSAFRGALKLRNWLAHGRWWPPKLGFIYTPELVFDISKTLIDSIPV